MVSKGPAEGLAPLDHGSADAAQLAAALLQASPDCVKLISLDGRLLAMSSQGLRMMEVDTFDRIANTRWASLWPEAEQPKVADGLAQAIREGSSRFQGFCPSATGASKWWDVIITTLAAPDGSVSSLLSVSRDITELKQGEERLEAASRAKSEFLANMSHEIRTPLNGVLGVAGALAKTQLAEPQREMVSIIETSAKTLETLLSDILDLARIEAGKMELRHEPFDLQTSVNACAALFDAAAQAKGLDLDVSIAPDALGAYLGDAPRIRQILSNLLSNAVKFTDRGRIRLTVGAERHETSSSLTFEVTDTGIGFDSETKVRLFSRFEQADGSITRRFGGSGLGLSISLRLAEAMGGAVDAHSRPGEGATFTLCLELPRCVGDLDLWCEADAETPPHDPLLGLQVLLAEDHPTNRRVVELILGAAGVDLTCVENGAEAVAAAAGRSFDLILMDMQMPVMDGLTAIAEIRAAERTAGAPPAPIHVLTANAMPEHVEASYAAGADGHLAKPIVADTLLELTAQVGFEQLARKGASGALKVA